MLDDVNGDATVSQMIDAHRFWLRESFELTCSLTELSVFG